MRKKRKVLIFLQNGVGGAERMSVLIGKNLDPDSFETLMVLIGEGTNSSIMDFIPERIRTSCIETSNPLFLTAKIDQAIHRERPDVVFSSVFNISNKILLLRSLFPNTRFIIRCDNYLYTYTRKQQKLLSVLYPKADIIIAQTEEMKEELLKLGIPDTGIKVLHNPIDRQTIDDKLKNAVNPYSSNGYRHIVASGRFAYQKGFDLLIEAFARLCKKRNDCDLTIVGDYEYGEREIYNQIIGMAERYGCKDRINCVGYQSNPYPYIRYADCFALSSRWEGLPNVLIEALYLGTPAAAFKCIPIIERIIEEGKTGYCAKKEDIHAFAEAMEKAVDLGRIHSTYQSSDVSEFTKLFDLP